MQSFICYVAKGKEQNQCQLLKIVIWTIKKMIKVWPNQLLKSSMKIIIIKPMTIIMNLLNRRNNTINHIIESLITRVEIYMTAIIKI